MNMGSIVQKDLHRASYFIGIDSDGCVFDTMETKHRQAFIPALCEVYELDHLAPLVEEVWTGINLYSGKRGLNRFPALVQTIEDLKIHPVLRRFPGVLAAILPDTGPLKEWIANTSTLSNESLEREIARRTQLMTLIDHGRSEIAETLEELERCLLWSKRVNELAVPVIEKVEMFRGASNFLKMLRPNGSSKVDLSTAMVVISQSSHDLLSKQWDQHQVSQYVDAIHGQEDGSKINVLKRYVREGGFTGQMLIIGDAPGDLEAAQAMGASFFPVLPGHESESWERLAYEAWPIFAAGGYTNEYQNRLISNFFQCLTDARKLETAVLRRVS